MSQPSDNPNAVRHWVRFRHVIERADPFLRAVFSRDGLGSRTGRILIRGKFRRMFLATMPALARALQRHYGLTGGCARCGTSCNLLNRCPHWDESAGCTVYHDRPNVCRLYPITPADIRDRDMVNPQIACGMSFAHKQAPTNLFAISRHAK